MVSHLASFLPIFSLLWPFHCRLRVRQWTDRRTDDGHQRLMPPLYGGGAHNEPYFRTGGRHFDRVHRWSSLQIGPFHGIRPYNIMFRDSCYRPRTETRNNSDVLEDYFQLLPAKTRTFISAVHEYRRKMIINAACSVSRTMRNAASHTLTFNFTQLHINTAMLKCRLCNNDAAYLTSMSELRSFI